MTTTKERVPIPAGRLETLSDGVIAIVITLMILEIKVPHVDASMRSIEVWRQWLPVIPPFVAYIFSFVMIGVLWVNHHQFFRQLKQVDKKVLWYNLFLLLWMCVIPIPTAFLGANFQRPEATALYGFNMFMVSLAFAIMRDHVHRNEHLMIEHLSVAMRLKLRRKLFLTVALYFASIFLGYLSTWIPIGIFVLIVIIYFMPQDIVLEAGGDRGASGQ